MSFVRFACVVSSVSICSLTGCSDAIDEDRETVYEVSGTITMSGGPVANAVVSFSPREDQPVATGRTDSNGIYRMTTYEGYDGAAAGEYVVLVSKSLGGGGEGAAEVDPDNDPNYGEAPMHEAADSQDSDSGLPERYGSSGTSDLTADVTPDGENVFDFELSP